MIIGLTGRPPAGSGKDTAADYLVKEYGLVKVSLADPLKRICFDVFGWSSDVLWGASDKRNKLDPKRSPLTPRYALQQIGDWGRGCYPDTWVDYCLKVCKTLLDTPDLMYTSEEGIVDRVEQTSMGEWVRDDAPEKPYSGAVIPDVRYDTEAKAIKKAGGKIWCLLRPGAGLEGEAGRHSSEDGISEDLVDNCIKNDGSFEWLYEQVQVLMKQ